MYPTIIREDLIEQSISHLKNTSSVFATNKIMIKNKLNKFELDVVEKVVANKTGTHILKTTQKETYFKKGNEMVRGYMIDFYTHYSFQRAIYKVLVFKKECSDNFFYKSEIDNYLNILLCNQIEDKFSKFEIRIQSVSQDPIIFDKSRFIYFMKKYFQYYHSKQIDSVHCSHKVNESIYTFTSYNKSDSKKIHNAYKQIYKNIFCFN